VTRIHTPTANQLAAALGKDLAVPLHDWTHIDAAVFHAFHHDGITEIARALNLGLLPASYYARPEQLAGRFGPDVLALRTPATDPLSPSQDSRDGSTSQHGTGCHRSGATS